MSDIGTPGVGLSIGQIYGDSCAKLPNFNATLPGQARPCLLQASGSRERFHLPNALG